MATDAALVYVGRDGRCCGGKCGSVGVAAVSEVVVHDVAVGVDGDSEGPSPLVEVCLPGYGGIEHVRLVAFPPGATAGRVSCLECEGTGWWGYSPTVGADGPCVPCKGSGLWWVALY